MIEEMHDRRNVRMLKRLQYVYVYTATCSGSYQLLWLHILFYGCATASFMVYLIRNEHHLNWKNGYGDVLFSEKCHLG